MSFLGNVMKSVINPATLLQLATGPAGWASLALRTIGAAIGQEVIQQIGQKLGLPQPMIDMAKQAFSAAIGQPGAPTRSIGQAVGEFAAQTGMSVVDQATTERQANDAVHNIMRGGVKPAEGEEKGSWLVALARAMGATMDKKANQMKDLSDKIQAEVSNGDAEKKKTEMMSNNTLLQGFSQELNILSNAFATISKSLGEAQTTAARKG